MSSPSAKSAYLTHPVSSATLDRLSPVQVRARPSHRSGMLWRVEHLDLAALDAGLDEIRGSPRDVGSLDLIVRRPEVEAREILEEGLLDAAEGLVGDCWRTRSGSPNAKAQLTLANVRAVALVARDPDRRALAGDQLYIDFDLSAANTPPGTRLAIGTAVVEITDLPHTGCRKYL